MLKHLFTFICKDTSLDDIDGQLSAFKIHEAVVVPKFMGDKAYVRAIEEGMLALVPITVVSGWHIDEPLETDELQMGLQLFNASQESLAEFNSPLKVDAKSPRINIREPLNGLPVKGLGIYTIKLTLSDNDKVLGRSEYEFTVLKFA